ncbi:unnamed protein product [Rotaria sp. Silwood2]|nr:unnamed protein product [Rotaria sp. Silwood2]CAF3228978.1 unnamed protein product [Rotaria sp. Silwood2]CAF4079421.1 unnamed protein product [Rotaria sp. Silwood2]
MAKVVTRPQRFTPEEWKLASKVKHKNTERDRSGAERLILECDRLDQEGRGTVDRTLADVNKKLGTLCFIFCSKKKQMISKTVRTYS